MPLAWDAVSGCGSDENLAIHKQRDRNKEIATELLATFILPILAVDLRASTIKEIANNFVNTDLYSCTSILVHLWLSEHACYHQSCLPKSSGIVSTRSKRECLVNRLQ